MKRTWPAIAALATLGCSLNPAPVTGFLDRSVTVGSHTYPYQVYVPRDWSPDRAWPVILFLHGAGERGNDGLRETQIGLAALIRNQPEKVPAVAVFPQVPENEQWIGGPAEAAMAALDRTIAEYHGDPRRVSLTGLSLGGYGTWHLALLHPRRFAALVPVCGGIVPAGSATSVRQSPLTGGATDPYAFTAKALRLIPVWIFHGADDTVVLPSESRKMAEALRAEGAEVRYTEYPGVGHAAWERAYREEGLLPWLLSKRFP